MRGSLSGKELERRNALSYGLDLNWWRQGHPEADVNWWRPRRHGKL